MASCIGTRRDYPLGRSPHEFIEEQVDRTPDAPCVAMGPSRLSYCTLNSRANQLAHFLRNQGIGPEKIVAVYLDRSVEMLVSFLAILKSGGVYLPLDPNFPPERLAFMLADAEVSLVLTHSAKKNTLPETAARVIALDEHEGDFAKFPTANLSSFSRPEHLAYMIYTSGSTGKPKGVMIPRSALVNFLFSMREAPGIASTDVLLAITTISFDISILELLLPLVAGAQLVIASREQAADGRELRRLLNDHGVTFLQATPTSWRMLVESGWEGNSGLKILCGGEALTADLARQLLPRCGELWNMYGPTETTVWSSVQKVTSAESISLGCPIANTQLYVVDESRKEVTANQSGELLIGGEGLARGYLKRPELTAEKFIPDTLNGIPGARLYRTGDEVRVRPDGSLEFLGRLDHQVKLRGFRIELGEIESRMAQIEGVRQAVAMVREDRPGDRTLVAYYTGRADLSSTALLQHLKTNLPEYMIPSVFMRVEQFPLTPNAKLDRKALPPPNRERPLLAQDYIAPSTVVEKQLASLWCELLDLDKVGIDDSFFELGGNSLAVVRMANAYQSRFGHEIPPVKVFQHPTIGHLSRFLEEKESDSSYGKSIEHRAAQQRRSRSGNAPAHDAVAIIGMVGRFPGAENLEQLWSNLRNGVESISFFTPEELGPGIDPHLRNDPDYIRARGIIEGAELFDASFFGIGALEAKVMDPQQRVFLELAHQALENAGYDPDRYKGLIGIFAGLGDNHYYTTNLLTRPDLLALAGKLAVEYGNQKDYIALRAAYLLDLRGPAISLNTACSTTLLAADHAFRSLLDFECDIALAGGVDITVPQKSGFLYQEGGTFAKDGHCRPFDADATGTMFCDGAGVVVLKRLADAIADGDSIYAVLRGTGKNNNGARPASFLAPSVEGQAEAIAMAQARADVDVETIRYLEAHGTGTPVGDPIEIEALCKVFQAKTSRKQFCTIGSIKGNIGHPTNAAGVAGLIKAALVLHHEEIPATLHFKNPNPKIDFANSPFQVADRLIPFPRGKEPRRAAVSSFGFGGTNVHVILEEAPLRDASGASRPMQLLPLSAKTPAALEAYSRSFAAHLDHLGAGEFADAAFTLQQGRKQMAQRRFVVAADPSEAAQLLRQPNPLRCGSKKCERRDPPIVFLFGGQGTQYVNMGLNLYQGESLFRAIVDDCCEFLKPHLGRDLRELLYPQSGDEETARVSLQDTFYTQPSIFVIEYALARFWQSLGVQPAMMAGHSIGEFVVATLAGVMDLQDALRIIALRGKLMQSLPRGSMLAISAGAEKVQPLLPPSIQIASNNSPSLCVAAGPESDIAALAAKLRADGLVCRPLHTSHAFHSAMMDPIIEPLRAELAKQPLQAPARPFVSTVTGRLITEEQATDPAYWANHARETVQFSKAVQCLQEQGYDLFLECGPRSTLCSLTRQHFSTDRTCAAIPTFADTHENSTEYASMLFALGSLWQNGVSIDWEAFYAYENRHRIALPVYPFERQRYWIDPAVSISEGAQAASLFSDSRAAESQPSSAAPGPNLAPQGVTPQGRKERLAARLSEILAPISGREAASICGSTTFLEQGFDSLSLTQVALAIRKEFGVKLSFSQLMNQFPNVDMVAVHLDQTMPPDRFAAPPNAQPSFASTAPNAATLLAEQTSAPRPAGASLEEIVATQARTIASLVGLLEKAGIGQAPGLGASYADTPTGIEPVKSAPPIPQALPKVVEVESTVPQRGIYFSSRLSENLSASYNESMSVRFTGTISVPKLTRAIQQLVERHDALRASFNVAGSVMRIVPALSIPIPVTDLSKLADLTDREKKLEKLIAQEVSQPFPLPGGPLFRSHVVLLGTDSAVVILTGHHIICDGWSLDVLIHDLCAFYSSAISGAALSLPAPSSYGDYAREVAQRTKSEEFHESQKYWYAKFAGGFPALLLPSDQPRSGRRSYAAHRLKRTVDAPLVSKLRELAAKQGCSFFAVTLGALSILLARVSRQRRFVLALPTAEQPVLGQPELVGHCVALLPYVVELMEGETISAFLGRVQRDLGAAHDHAAFTLVNLLADLRLVNPVQGAPPVPAGLTSFKKFQPHELPQSGFSVDYVANPKAFESFEWYLSAIEAGDVLDLHCHYDTGLFEQETIEEWLTGFESILQDIAADPSREAPQLARLMRARVAAETPSAEVMYALASTTETPLSFPSRENSLEIIPPSPDASTIVSFGQEEPLLDPLQEIFCKVLNRPSVLPDDDFFALGGHSMMAAQLFARLERDLGLSVPLSILYEASTPRRLASKLSGGPVQRNWKSLVPINPSGNRPPLFLVHGGGGNVLMFRDLGRLMSPDYPLYALQSQKLDGSKKYLRSIEEMAAQYLEEILELQPAGPYYLGGFCMGAQVAFEMAQRLRRNGQMVNLLVAIDSYNFNGVAPRRTLRDLARYQGQKIKFHCSNLLHLGLKGQVSYLTDKLTIALARELGRFRVKMNDALGLNRYGAGEEFIEDINDRAMFAYVPRAYPGKMTIVRPKKNYSFIRDPLNGWGQVAAGGVDLIELPVDPGGIFIEPYVQSLADNLKKKMDATTGGSAEYPVAVAGRADSLADQPEPLLAEFKKSAPDILNK